MRTLTIIATAGIICFASPFYARTLTGGHKIVDAIIVSMFYVTGAFIIGKLLPKESYKDGTNSDIH